MLSIKNDSLDIDYEDENNINIISDLNMRIHKEFQQPYMQELYTNPEWTERAFWVAIIAVEDQTQLDLHEILKAANVYLKSNQLPIPLIDWECWVPEMYSQRDILKMVRQSINDNQSGGLTARSAVKAHTIDMGVSPDQFEASVVQLRRSGVVMEPKEGYLKCI